MNYQLFYSLRSPFARRIRLALLRLGVPFEPMVIDVFKPTEELFKANPLALVPILRFQDGRTLPDSATILEYLHESHGQKIWPAQLDERFEMRRLSTLSEGIMTMTVNLFLEGLRQHPDPESLAEYQDAILRTLVALEDSMKNVSGHFGQGTQMTQPGWDLMVAIEYLQLRASHLGNLDRFPALKGFYRLNFDLDVLRQTHPPA